MDQVVFIQQGGRNRHEHICESLELFAREVLPEFKRRDAIEEKAKLNELAPYVKAARERIETIKRHGRRPGRRVLSGPHGATGPSSGVARTERLHYSRTTWRTAGRLTTSKRKGHRMSIDQLELVVALLSARNRPQNPTVEEYREGFERLSAKVGVGTNTTIRQVETNGVPGEMVSAEGASEDVVHVVSARRGLRDWLTKDTS